jgi:hypothetical protein
MSAVNMTEDYGPLVYRGYYALGASDELPD